jgi:uncharacterized protein YegP (UPF0339 family)
MAQFEIRRASNQQYYWVFQANNNEVVATSETYVAKASAQNAINVIKAQAAGASVLDRS